MSAAVEQDVEVTAHDLELDNSWGVKKIGEDIARAAGRATPGVKVAVIDTGIDYTHPDLAANYKGGWDFVNNDALPMDDNTGRTAPGQSPHWRTAQASSAWRPIASCMPSKCSTRAAAGHSARSLPVCNGASKNGIQVTSNSYGTTTDPGSTVQQAYDNAAALGLVMVASAGNGDARHGHRGLPARYSSVIAVAATDANDAWASWSSTGPAVELAAPGVSIYSTMPGGGYGSKSGTSMACPHVAGAAAVLIGALRA
ncbi:MAG: S8 family serine peptidase [Planctomycetaceae bacterium]